MQPVLFRKAVFSQHVLAYYRHRLAVSLMALRRSAFARWYVRGVRSPERVEWNRRNAAAWREIAEFLSSDPRRGNGGASAPGARS